MKKENWKAKILFFVIYVFLFLGIGFYLVGKELYGFDAALIWTGGMLVLISVQGLVNYYVKLLEETR